VAVHYGFNVLLVSVYSVYSVVKTLIE